MRVLAAAGYHAVAPYLRGFPPTEIPHDGFFDRGTLATDIAELIRELGARSTGESGRPASFGGAADRLPTLALCGGDDLRAELMADQAQYFTGEYRFEFVAGAGHFLYREKPMEVTRLILHWRSRRETSGVADHTVCCPPPNSTLHRTGRSRCAHSASERNVVQTAVSRIDPALYYKR